jgi:nitric oxide reductase NorQ protein
LCSALKQGMHAILIGETGTGKTSLARDVVHDMGRELYRVNMDGGITPDQLTGRMMLKVEGEGESARNKTQFEEGILPRAMREGAVLLVDEINAALADTLFVLSAALERPARLFLPETQEEIAPKDGFAIVATMNPVQGYAGTRDLNHSIFSRFGICIRFKQLEGRELLKALGAHTPEVDGETISAIGATLEVVQKLQKAEEIITRVCIREAIQACELVRSGLDMAQAIEYAIAQKLESHERELLAKNSEHIKAEKTASKKMTIGEMLVKMRAFAKLKTEHATLEHELSQYKALADLVKAMYMPKEKDAKGAE